MAVFSGAFSLVALVVLSAHRLRNRPGAQDLPLAASSDPEKVDPLMQVVLRSTDVRGVLADLLAHDDGTYAPLPDLLRRIGLASWEGMQANLAAGTFLLELDVPRPACFSIVSPDDAGRVCAARAYALRVALLAARGAFEADGCISTVVVNCHEHRSKETILSLRLDATSLGQLRAVAHTSALDTTGFPQGDAVRVAFDSNDWLTCVEPFLTRGDETVFPALRYRDAELDGSACSAALEEATGAQHVCELGIYEISLRASKWNDILSNQIATTGDAVSKLMRSR